MKLYFAPLEGITTCTYRNTHAAMFGGTDAYFAPFIAPSKQEHITRKKLRDILPERNADIILKPQTLVNQAEAFLYFSYKLKQLGYEEVNLNLGCPSGTVVNKGRGAGLLRDMDALERLLDEVYAKSVMPVTIKTRIGFATGAEMERLMELYNRYTMPLLIIHPRSREDFYNGVPDMETFEKAYAQSKNPVCYNGNVETAADFARITAQFSKLDSVMIGRGAIQNPAIFREIHGGERLTTKELLEFSHRLIENYRVVLQSDVYTLQKLKEVWLYMMRNYPEEKKLAKAMKKASRLSDFVRAMEALPEL